MNATAESLIQAARKVCCEIERFEVDANQELRSALIDLLYNADNFFDTFRNDEELDTTDQVALPHSLESQPSHSVKELAVGC